MTNYWHSCAIHRPVQPIPIILVTQVTPVQYSLHNQSILRLTRLTRLTSRKLNSKCSPQMHSPQSCIESGVQNFPRWTRTGMPIFNDIHFQGIRLTVVQCYHSVLTLVTPIQHCNLKSLVCLNFWFFGFNSNRQNIRFWNYKNHIPTFHPCRGSKKFKTLQKRFPSFKELQTSYELRVDCYLRKPTELVS